MRLYICTILLCCMIQSPLEVFQISKLIQKDDEFGFFSFKRLTSCMINAGILLHRLVNINFSCDYFTQIQTFTYSSFFSVTFYKLSQKHSHIYFLFYFKVVAGAADHFAIIEFNSPFLYLYQAFSQVYTLPKSMDEVKVFDKPEDFIDYLELFLSPDIEARKKGVAELFCINKDKNCKAIIDFFTSVGINTGKKTEPTYGFRSFLDKEIRKEPLLDKLSKDEKKELYENEYLNQPTNQNVSKKKEKNQNFLSGYCNIFK